MRERPNFGPALHAASETSRSDGRERGRILPDLHPRYASPTSGRQAQDELSYLRPGARICRRRLGQP